MLIEILTRFMQYDGHGGGTLVIHDPPPPHGRGVLLSASPRVAGMLMIQHMGGGDEQDVDGFCGKIQQLVVMARDAPDFFNQAPPRPPPHSLPPPTATLAARALARCAASDGELRRRAAQVSNARLPRMAGEQLRLAHLRRRVRPPRDIHIRKVLTGRRARPPRAPRRCRMSLLDLVRLPHVAAPSSDGTAFLIWQVRLAAGFISVALSVKCVEGAVIQIDPCAAIRGRTRSRGPDRPVRCTAASCAGVAAGTAASC